MSVMEKRLQLLLDAHRYGLVADEATRTGRSVAAVIREAIDHHLGADDERERRAAALGQFLDLVAENPGPAAGWQEIKAELDEEFLAQVDKKTGMRG